MDIRHIIVRVLRNVTKYFKRKKLPVYLISVAFLLAAVSNYKFENNFTVAKVNGEDYLFNDYYHFVMTAAVIFIASSVPLFYNPKELVYGVFFSLCLGKISDEIFYVIIYGPNEFLFDVGIFTAGMIIWSWRRFREFLYKYKARKLTKESYS